MTIGDRVKQRRQEIGLSVDELAKKLGKNRATIYRYESNDIENFPTNVLEPLAQVLNTTPAYLMGWESNDELRMINEIISDEKERVFNLMGSAFNDADINHMRSFDDLNWANKKKVIVYTNNILDIQKLEEEQKHLLPVAAHDRTDIEVTDEMKKHDKDFMMDPKNWKK